MFQELTTIAGGVIGGIYGGPAGASAGATMGNAVGGIGKKDSPVVQPVTPQQQNQGVLMDKFRQSSKV